jgi:hypothetical protein
MRWHRACKSFCGFQSLSKMMTVSAALRLIPRPTGTRAEQEDKDVTAFRIEIVDQLLASRSPSHFRQCGRICSQLLQDNPGEYRAVASFD